MNAYEIVENLINNFEYCIGENELKEMEDGEIVLAILKTKYNAKYIKPIDNYGSGFYSFDNPKIPMKKGYSLGYYFPNQLDDKIDFFLGCVEEKKEILVNEILRLDKNVNAEDIYKDLFTKYCFVGNERIWIIKNTKVINFEKIEELKKKER